MSANLQQIMGGKKAASAANSNLNAGEVLKDRQSDELILGLSGPVGANLTNVKEALEILLKQQGYKVVHVKISSLFDEFSTKHGIAPPKQEEESEEFNRIWGLQDVGNGLRKILGDDLGAQLAIKEIGVTRAANEPATPISEIKPKKVAYIVDQLKHPKEVLLLRTVYGNLFYMIGVLASYQRRKAYLGASMKPHLAERLMDRDKSESDKNGQQLEKTLQHADFFLNNSRHNLAELSATLKRFVDLIHGENGITPSAKERGMFAAFTASLRSACLSRQVGASIVNPSGTVVATGCNDVPAAGGGLYEAGLGDQRCVVKGGLCYNDQQKDVLRRDVVKALIGEGVGLQDAERYANAIRENTRLKDLIEFSRAVHAEMDAIIDVARTGSTSIEGCSMFTTTYPCHSCARHIVAAGIRKVYFIEPYEKSLAGELHDDSIVQDPDQEPSWKSEDGNNKVAFVHFEGVSPHRFTKLFHAFESRKDKQGNAIKQASAPIKKVPEYLDDYIELEARVIKALESH